MSNDQAFNIIRQFTSEDENGNFVMNQQQMQQFAQYFQQLIDIIGSVNDFRQQLAQQQDQLVAFMNFDFAKIIVNEPIENEPIEKQHVENESVSSEDFPMMKIKSEEPKQIKHEPIDISSDDFPMMKIKSEEPKQIKHEPIDISSDEQVPTQKSTQKTFQIKLEDEPDKFKQQHDEIERLQKLKDKLMRQVGYGQSHKKSTLMNKLYHKTFTNWQIAAVSRSQDKMYTTEAWINNLISVLKHSILHDTPVPRSE